MIRLLQHHTPNWKSLIDISRPIHEEYCNRHGYSLHIKEVPAYEKYTGIDKLQMILDCLDDGDIGLVMDADSVVTNLHVKVEYFLEQGKDLYLCSGVNCGVMVVKKTDWLTQVVEGLINKIKDGWYHCEQDAIEALVNAQWMPRMISIKKHPAFNSFIPELYGHIKNPEKITERDGRWVEGSSFVLHLPSLGMNQREEIMKSIKITR